VSVHQASRAGGKKEKRKASTSFTKRSVLGDKTPEKIDHAEGKGGGKKNIPLRRGEEKKSLGDALAVKLLRRAVPRSPVRLEKEGKKKKGTSPLECREGKKKKKRKEKGEKRGRSAKRPAGR